MSKKKATEEEVRRAAERLLARGLGITQRAVHEDIGGSFSTIGMYLPKIRRELQGLGEIEIPAQVQQAADAFAANVWKAAEEEARSRYERSLRSTDASIERLEKDLADDAAARAALEERVQELSDELDAARGTIADLNAALRHAREVTEDAKAARKEAEERAGRLHKTIEGMMGDTPYPTDLAKIFGVIVAELSRGGPQSEVWVRLVKSALSEYEAS